MSKSYGEKLKDPRWQKKRLEILQRDNFTCRLCEDAENTLHVHHKAYRKNTEPWDYPDYIYITLCENCHEEQHGDACIFFEGVKEMLQEHFLASEVWDLWVNLYSMQPDAFDGLLKVMNDYANDNVVTLEWAKQNNG